MSTPGTPAEAAPDASPAAAAERPRGSEGAQVPLLLLPGALVVFLSFQAGGFFPGATALVAIGLVLVLVLRITVAPRPFEGANAAWVAGSALLALFALWTLLSSGWSDAPARAIVEYDRALLYLLAFVVFGAAGRTPERVRWLLRGLAIGVVIVCACALVTRLAPGLWRVENVIVKERLSYPLTYWNALGLLAALGVVFCFGLTGDAREPRVSRVLAAAAIPLLSTTLVLTFSRGSIAAGIVSFVIVVVAARPALLLSALLAAGPAAAFAVQAALAADLVASQNPTGAAAAAQGGDVIVTLALCTAAAVVVRSLALLVDPAFERVRIPVILRRRSVLAAATAAAVAVAAAAFVVLDGPGQLDRQVDAFSTPDTVAETGGQRLTTLANNGRIDNWQVSLDAFGENRLRGGGAGTWALDWDLRRPDELQVNDGHSLYLEVLAELGVIGLLLLGSALALILVGLAARARGPERGPAGVLCAATGAWVLHAGIDWDWEMPAVTLWLFAAGGLALAAAPRPSVVAPQGGSALRGGTGRAVAAIACLVLALTPFAILRSQGPLEDAQRAFSRGDCRTAIDRALASSAALGSRPEPYAIVGLCDIRAGYDDLAVRAFEKAVARDPGNWEYRYGLALVRGANGMDPRPAARQAARLNPNERLAATAVRLFSATTDPDVWRRRALAARLPVE